MRQLSTQYVYHPHHQFSALAASAIRAIWPNTELPSLNTQLQTAPWTWDLLDYCAIWNNSCQCWDIQEIRTWQEPIYTGGTCGKGKRQFSHNQTVIEKQIVGYFEAGDRGYEVFMFEDAELATKG